MNNQTIPQIVLDQKMQDEHAQQYVTMLLSRASAVSLDAIAEYGSMTSSAPRPVLVAFYRALCAERHLLPGYGDDTAALAPYGKLEAFENTIAISVYQAMRPPRPRIDTSAPLL